MKMRMLSLIILKSRKNKLILRNNKEKKKVNKTIIKKTNIMK